MEPQQPPTNETPTVVTAAPPETMPAGGSKRRWLIVAAIFIALLLVAGGLALWHHSSTKNEATIDNENHKYEATVQLDGTSFMPATLTIRPDTEVFFENHALNDEGEPGRSITVTQSKAAANQVPQFDSGQIPAKSGYGYTFRNVGTYHFYDADKVTSTLTVIVQK